nr:hypothetical protein [Treponema paraluiscuniculi]
MSFPSLLFLGFSGVLAFGEVGWVGVYPPGRGMIRVRCVGCVVGWLGLRRVLVRGGIWLLLHPGIGRVLCFYLGAW